MSGSASDPRSV